MVHCNVCGCCVEGHDHHCPVMGICVADKTFKPFSLFLFYGGVQCLLIGVGRILVLIQDKESNEKSNAKEQFNENIKAFLVIGFTLVYGISLMGSGSMQLVLSLFPFIYKSEKDNHDPNYDRTDKKASIKRIFGSLNPLWWFVPL